jgi:hypothetical protein
LLRKHAASQPPRDGNAPGNAAKLAIAAIGIVTYQLCTAHAFFVPTLVTLALVGVLWITVHIICERSILLWKKL